MKIKILLSIFTIAFIISAVGQKPTLELTFSALDNGQSVPLDSIFIENLTQSGDTMLYAPNSTLLLDYETSIEDYRRIGGNSLSISQNYPNPFNCKTEFDLYLSKKEKLEIIARDIMGRQLFHYEKLFNPGNHSFAFFADNMGHYLITATGGQSSQTIKMFNAGRNKTNRGECKIVYIENKVIPSDFKNQIATNNFLYSIGDELG